MAAWLNGGRTRELELQSGARVDIGQLIGEGVVAGTDPGAAGYWGPIGNKDPRIVEAAEAWVFAFAQAHRGQHVQALAHLETAIGLNPSYADAYALTGMIHTDLGRPRESVPLLRTALRLQPVANHMYFMQLGRAYFFLGDAEQARVNLREALARNPANLEARVYLAATLSRATDPDAAWEAEEIRSLQPGFKIRSWLDTHTMTDVGQKAQLVAALDPLGL